MTQPPTADACNFVAASIGSVHIRLRVGALTLATIKETDTLHPSRHIFFRISIRLHWKLPAFFRSFRHFPYHPRKRKQNQKQIWIDRLDFPHLFLKICEWKNSPDIPHFLQVSFAYNINKWKLVNWNKYHVLWIDLISSHFNSIYLNWIKEFPEIIETEHCYDFRSDKINFVCLVWFP